MTLGERHVFGNGAHAIWISDGGTAVLLHNEGHGLERLSSSLVLHRALDASFPPEVRRRITLLTLARTMANACFRFAAPFLALIARGNGTSLGTIGIALAISELSGLLSPITGELVERLHRRTAMALGLAGVGLGTALAAASVHPAMFAVALVTLAQSKVMFDLGLGAWVSDRVPYEQRSRVLGITETSWALGLLLGVSLMGLVSAATSWRVGYVVGLAAVLVLAILVGRLLPADTTAHVERREEPRVSVRIRDIRLFLLAMFFLMATSQTLFVTFGPWLEDAFGFSPAMLSAVTFGLGFAELAASITSARGADRWGKERSAAIGAALIIPAGLGLVLGHTHMAIGIPFLILGIAGFEFSVVSAIPMGTMIVPGSPARGMALMLGAGTFGRAAASIPATRLYASHGLGWPAAMCTVLAAATTLTFVRLHHRV